jgi:hypothetical protein
VALLAVTKALALAMALAGATSCMAGAQTNASAPGLSVAAALEAARGLEPRARTEIIAVLDSARAAALPAGVLASKVVEGVSKGAAADRIAHVVHETFSAMRSARSILGAEVDAEEIAAGGGALRAGLGASDLQRIKAASRAGPATEALVVATDLVRRGVPTADAVGAVIRLAETGADGDVLLRLQADVAQDVAAGVAPRSAALERARMLSSRPKPHALPGPVPPLLFDPVVP